MKLKFNFNRGLERHIDDAAQSIGGMRDVTNLLLNAAGRLDGLYRGNVQAKFTAVYNRFLQWGDYTLGLLSNPSGTIQLGDDTTTITGPTGDGRATLYSSFCPLAIKDDQARILSIQGSTTFTDGAAYIGIDAGNGWGNVSSITGTGPYVVNFGSIKPQTQTNDPQYVIFDIDGGKGSTTAEIRAITGFNTSGSDITDVTYTGTAAPSNYTYVYLIYGASSTDTFKPDGFVTMRERLAAYKDNELYFAGFIGSGADAIDPDPLQPYYWYELNSVTVGHSGQGKIIRCLELNDSIIVFLENAIYRVSGYPPINGAFDNQLVVRELSNDLGISSYDAAAITTDGNTIFFIGNDQRLYALSGQMVEISEPIREHSRFRNLSIVNCTDKYAIFTGTDIEAQNVPNELFASEAGLRQQTPPAFVFHIKKQVWSILDPYSVNENNELNYINDPAQFGVFGAYELRERTEICLSQPDGIVVLNDTDIANPGIERWLASGLATHQIPIDGGLSRVDQVNVLAENAITSRLSTVSPAENPTNAAPSDIARDIAQNSYGNTSRFGNYFSDPQYHNFVSLAVGSWGDKLVGGQDVWSGALSTVASGLYQQFTYTGRLDRIDVLVSDQSTDIQVIIFENNAGLPSSTKIFDSTYADAVTGRVNSAVKRWLPIPINIEVDGTFWVQVIGTQAYKYPSGESIYNASAVQHAGHSFCIRLIEEAGKAFAAKSIIGVSAEVESTNAEF